MSMLAVFTQSAIGLTSLFMNSFKLFFTCKNHILHPYFAIFYNRSPALLLKTDFIRAQKPIFSVPNKKIK